MILAYTHRSNRGSGTEVPGEYVFAYVAVAVIVWAVVAIVTARRTAAREHRGTGPVPPPDGEQMSMSVVAGGLAALAWPLSAVACLIWLTVRHFTHPRRSTGQTSPLDKEG